MHTAGLTGVDLSVDTLNRALFERMRRRPSVYIEMVLATFH